MGQRLVWLDGGVTAPALLGGKGARLALAGNAERRLAGRGAVNGTTAIGVS